MESPAMAARPAPTVLDPRRWWIGSAFVACAVLAGIGLALALLLPGRPRETAHELPERIPAASARS